MWLLGLGVVLLLLKVAGFGPVAQWSWLWVLAPFALAAAWWAFADASGYTKRKAMQRDDERKEQRRQRNVDALGLGVPKSGLPVDRSARKRSGAGSDPSKDVRAPRGPRP